MKHNRLSLDCTCEKCIRKRQATAEPRAIVPVHIGSEWDTDGEATQQQKIGEFLFV